MSLEQPVRVDLDYYESRASGIASVMGVSVAEARRDLAARHGFSSWRELRGHVEAMQSGEEPPTPFVLAYRAVVLQGSKIWDSSWREERASAYDVSADELDELYRERNTLKVSIYPVDIAQAVMHFASERRSGKSTGNVLNVDGGVPAAYPR